MKGKLERSWQMAINGHLQSDSFRSLSNFVKEQYDGEKVVYPDQNNLFNAFNKTPFDDVSVVVLGQDPYHGSDQAIGLSFSVPKHVKNPPSLRNIFKELEQEYGKKSNADVVHGGDLSVWANQGVLLLNSVLTVEAGKPGSHVGKGWEGFTDNVIKTISDKKQHVVFLLWGNYAKTKAKLIDSNKHLVLTASHPSPFSAYRGFFACNHFRLTNQYLKKHAKNKIIW